MPTKGKAKRVKGAGTTTTTKTNKRGVVKKRTTGPGVNLKQKTKPSGQQKIKGTATTTKGGKKLTVRNKGVVKSSRPKLKSTQFKRASKKRRSTY